MDEWFNRLQMIVIIIGLPLTVASLIFNGLQTKIQAENLKVVREVTGKGLKEAKDVVDAAPAVVREGVKKDEAEELKKKLEEAGAAVELK